MNHGMLRVMLLAGCLSGPAVGTDIVSTGGDFTVRGVAGLAAQPSMGGDFAVSGTLVLGTGQPSAGGDFAAAASPDPFRVLRLPTVSDVPELRIAVMGDDVLVSWPDDGGTWRLEVGTSLGPPGVWLDPGGRPVAIAGRFQWRVPAGADATFFRLRR